MDTRRITSMCVNFAEELTDRLVNWSNILESIRTKNLTSAWLVQQALLHGPNCGSTRRFIQVKSNTYVHIVRPLGSQSPRWKSTCWSIRWKNRLSVNNAAKALGKRANWIIMGELCTEHCPKIDLETTSASTVDPLSPLHPRYGNMSRSTLKSDHISANIVAKALSKKSTFKLICWGIREKSPGCVMSAERALSPAQF